MLEYLDATTKMTMHQIFNGFVIIFLLALILHMIGRKLRCLLASKLGNFYDYLVLPGVLCHEAGRTLGCWLTGTHAGKFEIFHLDTDDAERVPIAVSVNPRFAFIKRFVILTSPIWLGCIIVCLISVCAAGIGFLPSYSECFQGGESVGLVSYVTTLLTQGASMLVSLIFVWHWTSPFCLLVFYILFCIGSQITMSGRSFFLIWQSILGVFLLLFIMNLIPGVRNGVAWLGDKVMPVVFVLHVILLFVAFLNLSFLIISRILLKGVKGCGHSPDRNVRRPRIWVRG